MLAHSRSVACPPLLCVLVALAGCDTAPISPGLDAGITPGTDAGPASDAPSTARDAPRPVPDGGCRTDADCEDGDPSTHALCQPFLGLCYAAECTEDAHCDDDNPCTLDYCLTDSCGHGSANCCETEADCFDGRDCTSDECSADSLCHWNTLPLPGCFACPDRDGDGSGDTWCGGTDCDDFDPMRSATLAEICTNGIDDDCDDAADGLDTSCRPANAMCPGTPIALGAATHGTAISMVTTGGPMRCGGSAFYTLTLTATSEVDVRVVLDMPEPPPTCEGCPPGALPQLNYRAYLESACGDTATDLLGSAGGCNYWDASGGGFFPGSRENTYSQRRVPPGSYTLEVQVGEMFGWREAVHGFDVTVTATPSVDAMCDGAPLTAGARAVGTTTGGADAFGTTCAGAARISPERVHPFTLAARSRVRLEVAPDEVTPGYFPAARVAILSACDAGATRVACLESSGSSCQATGTIEQMLEPGSYFALVEGRDGAALTYGLTLNVEAVGAACIGAPVIAASGMTSGTTAGMGDAFRDDRVCGSGRGPDAVYRLDVAVRSRVVLDAITSYARPLLRVYTGCGESRVGASSSTPRLDLTLEPGSYDIVVGSERAEDFGSFVLSTTILPL